MSGGPAEVVADVGELGRALGWPVELEAIAVEVRVEVGMRERAGGEKYRQRPGNEHSPRPSLLGLDEMARLLRRQPIVPGLSPASSVPDVGDCSTWVTSISPMP
jgi:hypothetical protein